MINGPWLLARARALATRAEREAEESRVNFLYQTLFGRSPTADESATAAKFLAGNSQERLIDLCHVLLNSNEFLYVD
jgi:hypothetical protein